MNIGKLRKSLENSFRVKFPPLFINHSYLYGTRCDTTEINSIVSRHPKFYFINLATYLWKWNQRRQIYTTNLNDIWWQRSRSRIREVTTHQHNTSSIFNLFQRLEREMKIPSSNRTGNPFDNHFKPENIGQDVRKVITPLQNTIIIQVGTHPLT